MPRYELRRGMYESSLKTRRWVRSGYGLRDELVWWRVRLKERNNGLDKVVVRKRLIRILSKKRGGAGG